MTGDRLPFNYQSLGGFLIRPEVGEGDALLYKYRKVKRKQISSSQLLIDPKDKKHSRSTDDLYSFFRPRNVQRSLPLATTIPAWEPGMIRIVT